MKEVLAGSRSRRCNTSHAPIMTLWKSWMTVKGKTLLSMAVFIGKTRLIDNFVIQ